MSIVTITVSGPDRVINFEFEVLRRALMDAGFVVTVENVYPANVVSDYHDAVRPQFRAGELGTQHVKLVADHRKWLKADDFHSPQSSLLSPNDVIECFEVK